MSLPPQPALTSPQQTLQWLTRPYAFLESCARELGDAFTIDFRDYGLGVVFSHPDHIQEVLGGDPEVFFGGAGNAVLKPFLGPHSLLLLEGEPHRRKRKLLMPSFSRGRVQGYGELIARVSREISVTWPVDEPFSVRPSMQRVAFRLIIEIVFGPERTARRRRLSEAFASVLDDDLFNLALLGRQKGQAGAGSRWEAFEKALKELSELIYEEIAERRAVRGAQRDDILAILLEAHDEEGQAMSDEEIHGEVLTLMATGHESTATALAWGIYWLLSSPQVYARALREVAALGPQADAQALAGCDYLEALVKEILRLTPVIPVIARQVQRPVRIGPYTLEPGMVAMPAIYLAHRRPDVYDEPERFRPERFLERTYRSHQFLPFGGGVRRCIGARLAMYEMKIVLGTILQKVHLELLDPEAVRPVRRMVTIAPSGGTRVVRRPEVMA
ncbi:cytochrome P450 [Lujinxingia litoralis]|uniref:Cytochrome P450 n=1 Tax=Lujinxingia litoralis TaxID=2211119 RepID=A0A328C5F8_9DELT|nr:cytochrome P450 [Lujinxingia litoralis]RAL20543.1 cytochrome P450 [Lujinxingia litoralis]